MPFPATLDGLREAGYKHDGDSKCSGCGAAIEWWITPRKKKMPTNFGTAVPHWTTCPKSADFKKDAPVGSQTVTTATLNMDWLKEQAKSCHCTVCKKLTGR